MAEKKMTRKEALTNVIEFLSDNEQFGDDWAEEIEVFSKMVASLDKASSKPKGKTSARIQNETYYAEMHKKMCARKNHEPVTPTWVAENVPGVMSSQRAVWVAKVGKELGEIKEFKVKKQVYYALIDWEPPTEEN